MKKTKTKDLSTEEIKTILQNLSQSPILLTSFEGGEPLLREDIYELLQFARTCRFYLLFTSSSRDLLSRPLEKYAPLIDFLHISIDEGHKNLDMFDLLPQLVKLPTHISVQTVVTEETITTLDWKVKQCWANGVKIVIIPASPMQGAMNCFPDINELALKVNDLRKKYPHTIHTPQGYFQSYKNHKCSSASIIIAPDGYLYYPCHILEQKTINLITQDLSSWLKSKEASQARKKMKVCGINCGWYQYYSIDSYLSPLTFKTAINPILSYKKR